MARSPGDILEAGGIYDCNITNVHYSSNMGPMLTFTLHTGLSAVKVEAYVSS